MEEHGYYHPSLHKGCADNWAFYLFIQNQLSHCSHLFLGFPDSQFLPFQAILYSLARHFCVKHHVTHSSPCSKSSVTQRKARVRKCHLGQDPIPSLMAQSDGPGSGVTGRQKPTWKTLLSQCSPKATWVTGRLTSWFGLPGTSQFVPVTPANSIPTSSNTGTSLDMFRNVTITLGVSITMPHALHQRKHFFTKSYRRHKEPVSTAHHGPLISSSTQHHIISVRVWRGSMRMGRINQPRVANFTLYPEAASPLFPLCPRHLVILHPKTSKDSGFTRHPDATTSCLFTSLSWQQITRITPAPCITQGTCSSFPSIGKGSRHQETLVDRQFLNCRS